MSTLTGTRLGREPSAAVPMSRLRTTGAREPDGEVGRSCLMTRRVGRSNPCTAPDGMTIPAPDAPAHAPWASID